MMSEEMTARIKRELKITWSDEDTDASIKELIADAEVALNHKLGAECDYEAPGPIRRLFINYCTYVYNNCLDEFDQAYMQEIYQIRHKLEVAHENEDTDLQ